MTDLIGEMIVSEMRAGKLPDETPGYKSYVIGGKIRLKIDDLTTFRLQPSETEEIANTLEKIAVSGGTKKMFLDGVDLKISRRGGGVLMEAREKDGAIYRRIATPSIAKDVARQLRSTIAHYFVIERIEKLV